MVTIKEVELFENIQSQLDKLHYEMSLLSKGKPDNPVNKFKLRLINEKLTDANSILDNEHRPFADFELFNEDDLPSNSDVVFVLSQYLNSLEGWRSSNIIFKKYKWQWNVKSDVTLYTNSPSRNRKYDG